MPGLNIENALIMQHGKKNASHDSALDMCAEFGQTPRLGETFDELHQHDGDITLNPEFIFESYDRKKRPIGQNPKTKKLETAHAKKLLSPRSKANIEQLELLMQMKNVERVDLRSQGSSERGLSYSFQQSDAAQDSDILNTRIDHYQGSRKPEKLQKSGQLKNNHELLTTPKTPDSLFMLGSLGQGSPEGESS